MGKMVVYFMAPQVIILKLVSVSVVTFSYKISWKHATWKEKNEKKKKITWERDNFKVLFTTILLLYGEYG